MVHDIKVIEGEKGLFIAMPSKKALDGSTEISLTQSTLIQKNRIQSMILEKYEQALTEENGEDQE